MTTPRAPITHPPGAPQRVTITVELLPSPLIEGLAERTLQLVVEELRTLGVEATTVAVELRGWLAAW